MTEITDPCNSHHLNHFYGNLPVLVEFAAITYGDNFQSVPDDWYIIITDVVDSTIAIEQGKYKHVNLIGSCCIVAILNIAKEIEVPFVFGGDGACLLIPPSLYQESIEALLSLQNLAQTEFKLGLRLGIIPVADVKQNYNLEIAKLRISDNYYQAILRGGGVTYATRLVKDKATTKLYQPMATKAVTEANLKGLECRWQDIPTRHEEILSLVIVVTAPNQTQTDLLYREVITNIEKIYGDEITCNPVAVETLNLSFKKTNLMPETKLFNSKGWRRNWYLIKIRLINLLGLFLMTYNIRFQGFRWGQYKQIVTEATDFKKFDDGLRMVISGTAKQRQKLLQFLEKKFLEGRLTYGYHVSDRALMTCLVFERDGRQVHFVDGADGGYAFAAKNMKEKMRT